MRILHWYGNIILMFIHNIAIKGDSRPIFVIQ